MAPVPGQPLNKHEVERCAHEIVEANADSEGPGARRDAGEGQRTRDHRGVWNVHTVSVQRQRSGSLDADQPMHPTAERAYERARPIGRYPSRPATRL